MNPKSPAFFCENCGSEVSSGSDRCPSCRREFSSVRCPECGFFGSSDLFYRGCPGCGYASGDRENGSLSKGREIKKNKILPVWVYRVLIVLLTAMLLGLLRVYFLL